jgi:hypothetical protein
MFSFELRKRLTRMESSAAPDGDPLSVIYASTTEGRTFTPRLRVPTLGSHPRHPQIVLGSSGRLFVAWDESVKGRRVAAAREVIRTAGSEQASFGGTITIDADDPAVYPVMAATSSGIVAAWTSGAASTIVRVRTLPTR